MHTLSSASRTCMASSSAVECTATVAMPSSLHARKTRSAISPRLAIKIFSNMDSFDDQQRLTKFDRLTVFDQDLDDGSGARRRNLVHRLHRLDDEQGVARVDAAADLDIGARAGLGAAIGGADHRRGDHAGMARGSGGGGAARLRR